MPGVAHTHEWNPLEGAAARYLCACGAPGRRNLAGKILEDRTVATVARVDPEDLFTARPSPEEVVDCTGRRRRLNPDHWVADDQDDGGELAF